jgi:hypothetical protein
VWEATAIAGAPGEHRWLSAEPALRTTNDVDGQIDLHGADPPPNRSAPPLLRESFSIRPLPNRYFEWLLEDAMDDRPKSLRV